jgi:hypothetical protein
MSDDVKPWDMLDRSSPKVSRQVAKERLDICYTCPEFQQRMQRCSKCGCFMKMKVVLEKAKCPLGKW